MNAEAKQAAEKMTKLFRELARYHAYGLAGGIGQDELFRIMREGFVSRWGVTELQAANMVRIVLAIVCREYTEMPQPLYSREDFEIIFARAFPASC